MLRCAINSVKVRSMKVYQYQNPQKYLLDTLSERQKTDPRFSIRLWAKEMALPSPSLLIMILQGTRPLRLKHVDFLFRGLRLNTSEQLYFRAMIQLANAESFEEKQLCELWLAELNPAEHVRIKEIDEYTILSKWIHFTILAMTNLKNFKGTAEEIYQKLGKKVSIHEIRSALIRLQEAGFLRLNEETKKLECVNRATSTRDDLAIPAAHEYYRQVFRLAEDAIQSQSVLEREFQALAIAIPHEKLPLAKEMIRRFRSQFTQAMVPEHATADDVYQLNLQFFRLTESPAAQWCAIENEGALYLTTEKGHV
jgi:uncharacterized protein (TIGR02147 family)